MSRQGRDPLQGGRSLSRWCNGEFDVLYTSLERDGAIAEVHSLLTLQPIFPSKISFHAHKLTVVAEAMLHLADLTSVAQLGVDIASYHERDYRKTQEIADAAFFLGFDGLVVPSARWPCANAVLFTDRIPPAALALQATEADPVNWGEWRKAHRGPRTT
ncbi:MAG: RES family NAD+ phosphorylase [Beijerinckiaceae bacterium]